MRDPRERLERKIPGETWGDPAALVERLDVRSRVEIRDLPVPDRALFLPDSPPRDPGAMPDAAPNAPLLIRIVKFPYALHPDRAQRTSYLETWVRPVRAPLGHIVRDARKESTLTRRERPTEIRTRPGRERPGDAIRDALSMSCSDNVAEPERRAG